MRQHHSPSFTLAPTAIAESNCLLLVCFVVLASSYVTGVGLVLVTDFKIVSCSLSTGLSDFLGARLLALEDEGADLMARLL